MICAGCEAVELHFTVVAERRMIQRVDVGIKEAESYQPPPTIVQHVNFTKSLCHSATIFVNFRERMNQIENKVRFSHTCPGSIVIFQ